MPRFDFAATPSDARGDASGTKAKTKKKPAPHCGTGCFASIVLRLWRRNCRANHYSVFLASAFFIGAALALGFQKSGSALTQFSSM